MYALWVSTMLFAMLIVPILGLVLLVSGVIEFLFIFASLPNNIWKAINKSKGMSPLC